MRNFEDTSLPDNHRDLRDSLDYRLAEFETWVNDVRTVQQPRFLPGEAFVKRLIRIVTEGIPALKESAFFVYVDEYENLAEYQQEIINAWLKHSEPPLIFNLAMKRNGFKTHKTTGDETLSNRHDFRVLDLEGYDMGNQFPVFAAEILLLKLALAGCIDLPIETATLRDPAALHLRRSDAYAKSVLDAVRGVFPSPSQLELARGVFADPSLRDRLVHRVRRGLKTRRASQELAEDLVSPDHPEASVVVASLLFRSNLPLDDIVEEMRWLRAGRDNRFTGSTDWNHNNFIGCLLQLYDGLPRPCPFYGGFDTFCRMARGNLRHLLELCHQSLAREDIRWEAGLCPVAVDKQAEAARQASAEFLSEVRSFGPQGNNLHAFVLRLGSIFALSQQQPSQSEPERSHFLVRGHLAELGQLETQFLSEAIKWSVLFEEKETKKKSAIDPEATDFVLNPIYAPYFHISYRKRRKVEFTPEELRVLMRGDYAEVRVLIQEFRKRWNVEIRDTSLPLFAHLEEGETQ